jgi:5-methylcytosine-specific restriction enzyme A
MGVLKDVLDKAKGKIPKDSKRSSKWPKVRKAFILEHNVCAACGETTKLEVHHICPFHLHPELELDPNNLITLCETASKGVVCHMNIGHNGDYKKVNENVVEDSKKMNDRLNN